MRLTTSVALLALLTAPALSQIRAPALGVGSNPIEPRRDPIDTAAEPASGLRCQGLLPTTTAAGGVAAGRVATGAPALGAGSNPIEPRRDPVDTRLEPNTGRGGSASARAPCRSGGPSGTSMLTRTSS